MGHSDISVTLNTYTHLKLEDAREEMNKLAKKKDEADTELQKLGIKKDQNPFLKHGWSGLKSCGLKLKNEAILDHFLDHFFKLVYIS